MKEKKCLSCGKPQDLCECDVFEADTDEEETEEGNLDGMRIKGPDGEDLTDEVAGKVVDEPLEGDAY